MTQLGKLITIGTVAGAILAGIMQAIHWLTGNEAYLLLYNADYIPVLKNFDHFAAFGLVFHFTFCITSVVALFYILELFQQEYRIAPYILIYTCGAAILFFLTLFTEQPPAATDALAWVYWTAAHAVYGVTVGILIKYWLENKKRSRTMGF